MKLSIVIPTCNRPTDLALCLDCLENGRQGLTADLYEVIVTDDGSAIRAAEALEARYPWVRFVEGPQKGPAANRNNGASHARGDWLVFTDDDCLPETGWLRAYVESIRANPTKSIFEGKTAAVGVRTRVDEEAPNNDHGGNLWSCNFCIRLSVFMELGRFDEAFPAAAMEDVEFRVRVQKAGNALIFVPAALVLHPWRRRKGMKFIRSYALSVRYFISKHPNYKHSFSGWALFMNFLRRHFRELRNNVWGLRGRGFLRELALDIYSIYRVLLAQNN